MARGLTAGEIASRLGQAPSTLSFHLSALKQAGLLHSTRQGRHVIFAVRFADPRAPLGFMTEACCKGRPELRGNVLFLCTHNSARSNIAEAILSKVGGAKFNACSAGSEPAPRRMPDIIERLKLLGHDVSQLRSKSWHE